MMDWLRRSVLVLVLCAGSDVGVAAVRRSGKQHRQALVLRGGSAKKAGPPRVLVVGSANADALIEVDALPRPGETVVSRRGEARCLAGGKGLNQAVAAAKLGAGAVAFVGQFGDDAEARMLREALERTGVTLHASSGFHEGASGRGYVFVRHADGVVASVVAAGANARWDAAALEESLREMVVAEEGGSPDAVMLQREVPEEVNCAVARACSPSSVIFLDAGGAEGPIGSDLLGLCDFVTPNRVELARLLGEEDPPGDEANRPREEFDDDGVVAAAQRLQGLGARNVLVTLGAEGAVLVDDRGGVHRQPALEPPQGAALVDETGAGDCFRAAFVVALMEGCGPADCLELGAAAGVLACTRVGGADAAPTRGDCDQLLLLLRDGKKEDQKKKPGLTKRGGAADLLCPWKFASRLNSMKDRRDLTDTPNDTLGWIARQGEIAGLDYVDFNFPQHLEGYSVEDVKKALDRAGLAAGTVCLRYPTDKFRRGAMTHPDAASRDEAIQLTIEATRWAEKLGANEVCVWSAFCGYDYSLQVDYVKLWDRVVEAFRRRQVCDAAPSIRVSLEFKPTDENTRFFAVPSTGAAMLLVEEINRKNMGLTLDVGHCLAAGENPAQSAALVASRGKLFGVQMNDGYQRIGAEDGLIVGSVHPLMALDFVLWLIRTRFEGHVYFDTFPRNEDPVREAELNIRRVRALWNRASRLRNRGIDALADKHDALAILELLENQGEL